MAYDDYAILSHQASSFDTCQQKNFVWIAWLVIMLSGEPAVMWLSADPMLCPCTICIWRTFVPKQHTTVQHKAPSRWHHQLAQDTCIANTSSCMQPDKSDSRLKRCIVSVLGWMDEGGVHT